MIIFLVDSRVPTPTPRRTSHRRTSNGQHQPPTPPSRQTNETHIINNHVSPPKSMSYDLIIRSYTSWHSLIGCGTKHSTRSHPDKSKTNSVFPHLEKLQNLTADHEFHQQWQQEDRSPSVSSNHLHAATYRNTCGCTLPRYLTWFTSLPHQPQSLLYIF